MSILKVRMSCRGCQDLLLLPNLCSVIDNKFITKRYLQSAGFYFIIKTNNYSNSIVGTLYGISSYSRVLSLPSELPCVV